MSGAKAGVVLAGGAVAFGLLAAASVQRVSRPTSTTGATKTGAGGGAVVVPVPTTGGAHPAPTPPVPVLTIPGTSSTGSGSSAVPGGPVWRDVGTAANAGSVGLLMAHIASRRPLTIPFKQERATLAAALIKVAASEAYPLDLLIGHAIAEGGGRLCMSPTAGSGAYGPLQTTAAACQTVGVSYPPPDVETALRGAVRYMRAMRQTYPTEAVNLTSTLRIYGLGIGNYRQFVRAGCVNFKTRPQSVWRAECATPTSTTYTGKIALETMLAGGAGFHTLPLAWWQR